MIHSSDGKTGNGDASRDALVCGLLKLVNNLVQIAVPARTHGARAGSTTQAATPGSTSAQNSPQLSVDTSRILEHDGLVTHPTGEQVDSPLTDLSKMTQALGTVNNNMK